MTFRPRLLLPVLALSLLALAALTAAPSVARADTLTWNRTYISPQQRTVNEADVWIGAAFNAVSFSSSSGWAVGLIKDDVYSTGTYTSLIAHSLNGGGAWHPEIVTSTDELYGVAALSPTNAWAVGANGSILHYSGGSWTSQRLSGWSGKSLRAIAFSGLTGWAVGDGRGIARTTDGGVTWSTFRSPSGTAALRSVAGLGVSETAVAVGDGGKIEFIDFTAAFSRSAPSVNLYGVTFTDAVSGWAVGDDATILRTSDGGSTWLSPQKGVPTVPGLLTSQSSIRAVAFADSNDGIAVGQYEGVWRTLDGGATWTVEQLDSGNFFLRGASFTGSSADTPVLVGRFGPPDVLTNPDQTARAYVGTWSDRAAPPVSIDTVAPTTSWPGWAATFVTKATIALTASDGNGSGVAGTHFVLDRGVETPGATVMVTTAGAHTISFWSVDKAGNRETPHELHFTVLKATKISITSNHTSITHRHSVVFSGIISPNMPNNTHIGFYVLRPGSHSWVRVTTRHTYSSHHWNCTYAPTSKGTWYFRVVFSAASGYTSSTSSSRRITVR